MRYIYTTLAGTFGIIGLIICFENIQMAATIMIGFSYMGGTSLFFPLLIILCIGIIAGFFAGLALMAGRKKDVIDETDDLDL
ncbi:hypothetical protein GW756_02055 [bacterium]|nr:hypothetical protein [bacterium]NCQ55576.1 hypothetical protein [Candidatus Parcubacteria bacterium]NCS67401.1 hypothetical protein [Candidatus Peregrinibacteria bacterium]NCS96127.1 hypothetical protein [bacterium]